MTFVGWMETVRTGSLAAIMLLGGCNPKVPETGNNEMENSGDHKFTNALIEETSPYLLQHAHNPVNWHAWNEVTLEKARREDKPLLVSIGYAACHWCHVMEHESFENEEVAEIMNRYFICVKVDREERPDVDQYYMSASNLITGGGGWPLNCFAMPDGRPFHGGTYFRTEDWKRLLHTVANEFQTNREKLSEFADKVSQGIKQGQLIQNAEDSSGLDSEVVHRSVINWMQRFDSVNGGDNRAPKFPLPDNYLFLMQYAHQYNQQQIWEHVEKTLRRMGNGGIFDQAGGGFCRYSVDGQWKVPHFEKMLYDNAQLIQLYAEAYKKTNDAYYLRIATRTAEFCMRELLSPEGVFCSSLDADSEGEEGKFYTWTEKELVETTGGLMDFARLYFQLDDRGKWEGKYILMRNLTEETIREELGLQAEDYAAQENQLLHLLMRERDKRIRPALDDKSLTSWNGLMVTGLVNLYQASGEVKYLNQARTTLKFLLQQQWKDGLLYRNYKNGRTSIPGFLEDYAFLIAAIIKMNEADHASGDLQLANELTQMAIERFYHTEDHLFQFTPVRSKEFHVAPVEVTDNVMPSSNAVMVSNLRKMYLISGRQEYEKIYGDLLRRIAPSVISYGSGYSHWMQVILDETSPSEEVVIIGKDAGEKARQAGAYYMPGTLLLTAGSPSDLLIFRDRYEEGRTWIYVCRDRVCQRPVERLPY